MDRGGYYHEYFLHGKPFLSKCMFRVRIKGTKVKAANSPHGEPDFYKMPAIITSVVSAKCVVSSAEPHDLLPENYAFSICPGDDDFPLPPLELDIDELDNLTSDLHSCRSWSDDDQYLMVTCLDCHPCLEDGGSSICASFFHD
jgi:hypothetical protein